MVSLHVAIVSPVVHEDLPEVGDVARLGVEQLCQDVLAPNLGRLAALVGRRGGTRGGGGVVDGRAGGGEGVVLLLRPVVQGGHFASLSDRHRCRILRWITSFTIVDFCK